MKTYANSVDPDETAHQDLHGLLFGSRCLTFATMDMSKFKDGRVHCRNSWKEGIK